MGWDSRRGSERDGRRSCIFCDDVFAKLSWLCTSANPVYPILPPFPLWLDVTENCLRFFAHTFAQSHTHMELLPHMTNTKSKRRVEGVERVKRVERIEKVERIGRVERIERVESERRIELG